MLLLSNTVCAGSRKSLVKMTVALSRRNWEKARLKVCIGSALSGGSVGTALKVPRVFLAAGAANWEATS